MNDLTMAAKPKTDQLNFDDFIDGKPKTITITEVKVKEGEQPVAYHYEGDNGKPWKPCKSMIRVLIAVWGSDGKTHRGRRLTLYGDPNVRFGPEKVGGIRISHMSNIDQPIVLPLTTTRGKKAAFTIQPLPADETIDIEALKKHGSTKAAAGIESLKSWWSTIGAAKQKAVGGAPYLDELKKIAESANPASEGFSKPENPATSKTPTV